MRPEAVRASVVSHETTELGSRDVMREGLVHARAQTYAAHPLENSEQKARLYLCFFFVLLTVSFGYTVGVHAGSAQVPPRRSGAGHAHAVEATDGAQHRRPGAFFRSNLLKIDG